MRLSHIIKNHERSNLVAPLPMHPQTGLNRQHKAWLIFPVTWLATLCTIGSFARPARAANPNEFQVFSYDFRSDSSVELPGRLFVPPQALSTPNQLFPIVLVLHGIKERGTDNEKQVRRNIDQLLANAKQRGFFLYAPQLPTANWYDGPIDNAFRMLAKAIRSYNIDSSRIYVTGLSLGGGGVWKAESRYADVVAGAAPVCSGWNLGTDPIGNPIMVGRPIWAFHAQDDTVARVSVTRNQVNAIRWADSKPSWSFTPGADADYEENHLRYREYARGGHNIWDRVYQTADLYVWLFAQRTLNGSLKPGETVLFDLGKTVAPVPDSQDRVWNSTTWGIFRTLEVSVPFARTTDGKQTYVSLTVAGKFGGETDNLGGGVTPFDPEIGNDGWATITNATEATNPGLLVISGLTPGAFYQIEIFASNENNDGGRGRSTRYLIGSEHRDLQAYNNSASTVQFARVGAAQGEIELKVYPTPGTTARIGQINTLRLTRHP